MSSENHLDHENKKTDAGIKDDFFVSQVKRIRDPGFGMCKSDVTYMKDQIEYLTESLVKTRKEMIPKVKRNLELARDLHETSLLGEDLKAQCEVERDRCETLQASLESERKRTLERVRVHSTEKRVQDNRGFT